MSPLFNILGGRIAALFTGAVLMLVSVTASFHVNAPRPPAQPPAVVATTQKPAPAPSATVFTPVPSPTSQVNPTSSVVYKYLTQPIAGVGVTPSAMVTQAQLAAAVQGAVAAAHAELYAATSPFASPESSLWKTIVLLGSHPIEQLSGVAISNATVSGLSSLTSGDIPDLSSRYLPVSGGTISGSLTLCKGPRLLDNVRTFF